MKLKWIGIGSREEKGLEEEIGRRNWNPNNWERKILSSGFFFFFFFYLVLLCCVVLMMLRGVSVKIGGNCEDKKKEKCFIRRGWESLLGKDLSRRCRTDKDANHAIVR
jgi:hypothetical protein